MMDAGIEDPVEVIRLALQNALSVAAAIAAVEAVTQPETSVEFPGYRSPQV